MKPKHQKVKKIVDKKTKQKCVFLAVFSLFLAGFFLACSCIFGWLLLAPRGFLVVSGDVRIDVQGWCDLASEQAKIEFGSHNKLLKESPNLFENMPANTFLAFKFEVRNLKESDAALSIRFANTFEHIFQGLFEYVQSNGVTQTDFFENAQKNNARLAFFLDDIYYEYQKNDQIVFTSPRIAAISELYLWRISNGEFFVGNPQIPSILLPGKDELGQETRVNIYVSLKNRQSSAAIEAYRKWFLGDAGQVGAGQEYAASLLGYTWEALTSGMLSYPQSTYANLIDVYLNSFVSSELESILGQNQEEGSKLNLSLSYIEFQAHNLQNTI